MPIYEYLCSQCNGKFQRLVRGFSDPADLACPRCGTDQVRRAVSRFAVLTSEDARVEAMADPANFSGLDENDPRSIARWAKKMGKELGEEAGEDWDQMVDQMLDEELNGEQPDGDAASSARPADDLGWD
jgi:putative FmdB family regulatory protein